MHIGGYNALLDHSSYLQTLHQIFRYAILAIVAKLPIQDWYSVTNLFHDTRVFLGGTVGRILLTVS